MYLYKSSIKINYKISFSQLSELVRTIKWQAAQPPSCTFSYHLMSDVEFLNRNRCSGAPIPWEMQCSTTTSTTTTTTTTTTSTTTTTTSAPPTTTTTATAITTSKHIPLTSRGGADHSSVTAASTPATRPTHATATADSSQTSTSQETTPTEILVPPTPAPSLTRHASKHQVTYVIVGVACGLMLVVFVVLGYILLRFVDAFKLHLHLIPAPYRLCSKSIHITWVYYIIYIILNHTYPFLQSISTQS